MHQAVQTTNEVVDLGSDRARRDRRWFVQHWDASSARRRHASAPSDFVRHWADAACSGRCVRLRRRACPSVRRTGAPLPCSGRSCILIAGRDSARATVPRLPNPIDAQSRLTKVVGRAQGLCSV
jgi:hypothetical protein